MPATAERSGLWRYTLRGVAPVMLALLAAAFVTPADAGPGTCRQIERQLASASSQPRATRRYDRAIRAQQVELQKVQAQIANSGCNGFLSALRPQCSALQSTLRRMESNLASLDRNRPAAGSGQDGNERAQLLAAYKRSGCDGSSDTVRTSALPKDKPALYDELFGEPTADGQQPGDELRSTAAQPRRGLCVRTCDGYFFPIAYSTTPANFTNDQQRCEAACPGTEVELYYDSVPDEDRTAMTSGRTGVPYSALPSAFLYKQAGYRRPAACGCNRPKGFSVIAGQPPLEDDPAQVATAPASNGSIVAATPLPASEPAAVSTQAASQERTASVETDAPNRPVRVVGPKFLPDPDEAIDLKSPARRP